jgi:hypothetical protein
MTGLFLVFWLSTSSLSPGWPEQDRAKLIGPLDQHACQVIEQGMNRWKSPVFAKCFNFASGNLFEQ